MKRLLGSSIALTLSVFSFSTAQAVTNPTFPWYSTTHNEVTGDFNGDGKSDSFIQAKARGATSGLMPTSTSEDITSPIYINWTSTHPQITNIEDWSAESYQAYASNLNANPGDELLLLGQQQFVFLHGDIITPIAIAPNVPNAIVSWDVSGNASYTEFQMDDSLTNPRVVFGDVDGDGHNEMLLQGEGDNAPATLLDSNGSLLQNFASGYLGLDWSTSSSILFLDVNGDGRDDMVITNNQASYTLLAGVGGQFVEIRTDDASTEIAPAIHVEPIPARDITSDAVGITTGQFRVDESGNATYQLPIYTPKGVGAIAPSLALAYNSGGGNSHVGVGWSISGVSSISRCGQSKLIDGYDKSVTLSYDDRFCLDGQRLVLVRGEYGKSDSEYRTVTESHTKVIAKGQAGAGPDYFEVWLKDGSYNRYGATSDSQFLANKNGVVAQEVLAWAQTYSEDRFSNRISYEYTEYESEGEFHINKVSYGPNVVIQFNFDTTRDDYNVGYALGGKTRLRDILNNITVSDGGVEVRKYTLSYGNYADNISRLQSITESKDGVNLKPLTFTWKVADKGIIADTLSHNGIEFKSGIYINLDSDPTPEWLHINGEEVAWIDPSTGEPQSSFGSPQSDWVRGSFLAISEFDGEQYKQVCQGYVEGDIHADHTFANFDINGDGVDEALLTTPTELIAVFFENGCLKSDFSQRTLKLSDIDSDSKNWFLGDINGDALPDLVYKRNDRSYVRYHLGANVTEGKYFSDEFAVEFETTTVQTSFGGIQDDIFDYHIVVDTEHSVVADFNRDGRIDLVAKVTRMRRVSDDWCAAHLGAKICREPRITESDYFWVAYTSEGSHKFKDVVNLGQLGINVLNDKDFQVADVNLDGISDIYYKGSGGYWVYRIFTGKEMLPEQSTLVDKNDPIWFLDLDQDGLNEVYFVHDEYLKYREFNRDGELVDVIHNSMMRGSIGQHISPVDLNSDGDLDFISVVIDEHTTYTNFDNYASFNKTPFEVANRITEVTTGMGNKTKITYKALNDPSQPNLYQGTNGWNMRQGHVTYQFDGPQYVVQKVESSAPAHNDASNMNGIEYRYGQVRTQPRGRGALGFEWLETRDLQTSVITRTTYSQDYPYIGSPLKSEVWYGEQTDNRLMSRAENTWNTKVTGSYLTDSGAKNIILPYMEKAVEDSWFFNTSTLEKGGLTKQAITVNEYNTDGELTQSDLYVCASGVTGCDTGSWLTHKRTVNTFETPDTTNWILGRLSSTSVLHERAGQTSITRSTAFEYDDMTGALTQEIIQPNSTDKSEYLKTEYRYDSFGNKTYALMCSYGVTCSTNPSESTSDAYFIQRAARTDYDVNGRYATKTYNGYGQLVSEVVARNELGLPTQVKNAQGVVSESRYTTFGDEYFTRTATGGWSKTTKSWCSVESDCPTGAVIKVTKVSAGGASSITYIDALGRPLRAANIHFDGRSTFVDTRYDNKGREYTTSQPYFSDGTAQYWSTNHFDVLNNVVQITHADGSVSKVNYLGLDGGLLKIESVNDKGHKKTEYKNAAGELVKVVDNLGGELDYEYGSLGNLRTVKFNDVLQSQVNYDALGRKTSMLDWDKGGQNDKAWHYTYNAQGAVIEQKDAKGQIVSNFYDREGRKVKQEDKDANGTIVGRAHWTFDNSTVVSGSIGQLTKIHDDYSNYVVESEFDDYGRADLVRTTIDDVMFIQSTTFDEYGRVFQSFNTAGGNYGLRYVYNEYGFVEKVRDARGGVNATVYQTINAMDAFGNVVKETLGNGLVTTRTYDDKMSRLTGISTVNANTQSIQDLEYKWDSIGNLEHRKELSGGKQLQELFGYDSLDRVTTVNGVEKFRYDATGNLTWKHDVGDYRYDGATCGSVKAGIHAVTQAGNNSYCYDLNGNMVSGAGRTVEYATFDKPSRIQKSGHTTDFAYSPMRSRYKRVDTNSSGKTTTYYLGGTEYIQKPNGDKVFRRQVPGAVIEINGSTATTHYVLKDHLGSTDVITNASGVIVQENSFDVFGNKRNATTWSGEFTSVIYSPLGITSQGYTGHEMLDEVGVIHMNGRIYDAKLGRFMQADPHVDGATDSKGFNRYSYVKNNPLKYTDPTGYKVSGGLKNLRRVARFAMGGVFGNYFYNKFPGIASTVGSIAASIVAVGCPPCGAAAAAMNAANNIALGGNLKSGVTSGVRSFATSYISAEIADGIGNHLEGINAALAHGTLSGTMTVLNGGKFGHGFVSAFFTKLAGGWINDSIDTGNDGFSWKRTIAAGVTGGLISQATGGKFTNGFMTNAIQWAYNNEAGKETIPYNKTRKYALKRIHEEFVEKDGLFHFDTEGTTLVEAMKGKQSIRLKSGAKLTLDQSNVIVEGKTGYYKLSGSLGMAKFKGLVDIDTGELTLTDFRLGADFKFNEKFKIKAEFSIVRAVRSFFTATATMFESSVYHSDVARTIRNKNYETYNADRKD
ncbi:FG-GAP-like repeat-containing protein [Pleionea sp. CnH1-48]|uniref:FG-GAP-like repeat-containing protein n=1 Tax=Pleionea sp. CnH1-48 TaxID=2954494 RepID=UPI00209771AB|nr:FG-GAP-like repeat-containing protein [Pleionea sp. CnH1-48]MCO7225740.1 FG-GAP-like repeat-containing protein [Pleionea sp. CnH1-48]